MKTDDFDYFLPEELIAQVPIEKRDSSKLMIVDKKTGEIVKTEMKNVSHKIAKEPDATNEYSFNWQKIVKDNPECTLAVLRVKGKKQLKVLLLLVLLKAIMLCVFTTLKSLNIIVEKMENTQALQNIYLRMFQNWRLRKVLIV